MAQLRRFSGRRNSPILPDFSLWIVRSYFRLPTIQPYDPNQPADDLSALALQLLHRRLMGRELRRFLA